MTLPMLELLCFEAGRKGEKSFQLKLTEPDFMNLAREIEDSYPETYIHAASYKFKDKPPIRVHRYAFAGIQAIITVKEDETKKSNAEEVL